MKPHLAAAADITRREFVRRSGAALVGAALGANALAAPGRR